MPDPRTVELLAEIIREVDGNHDLGAAALAEKIIEHNGLLILPADTARTGWLSELPGTTRWSVLDEERAGKLYNDQLRVIVAPDPRNKAERGGNKAERGTDE